VAARCGIVDAPRHRCHIHHPARAVTHRTVGKRDDVTRSDTRLDTCKEDSWEEEETAFFHKRDGVTLSDASIADGQTQFVHVSKTEVFRVFAALEISNGRACNILSLLRSCTQHTMLSELLSCFE
jgi:hypothetical protein